MVFVHCRTGWTLNIYLGVTHGIRTLLSVFLCMCLSDVSLLYILCWNFRTIYRGWELSRNRVAVPTSKAGGIDSGIDSWAS